MAATNRANAFAKAHKILKKYFKPVDPIERPVLEHLLFACCLENAPYEAAEKSFEQLRGSFFDWNEIRVSTVKELAECMPALPDSERAASNLRRALNSVFESSYSFDMEGFKKMNLGIAQQKLQKFSGVTPFVVHYLTQTTLGGHAVPLDRGALQCLDVIVGLTDKEKSEATVSGLERAIPKNKGIEFGSLLHQLGADMVANPMSTNLHKILLEIAPDAKDRLPKRQVKPSPKAIAAAKLAAKTVAKPAEKPAEKGKPVLAKKPEPAKPAAKKEPVEAHKTAVKKDVKKELPVKKPTVVLQKKKAK